jgi:hypothetical protein
MRQLGFGAGARGMTAVLAAGCAAVATVTAQGASLSVTKVDYTTTRLVRATGETVVVETGTYYLAPDGRQRIEHVKNGVETAEIIDYRADKRIALDLARREAVVGSNRTVGAFPRLPGQPEIGGPTGAVGQNVSRAALGTRDVQGLSLEGTRMIFTLTKADGTVLVYTADLWAYRFANRHLVPVILEERFDADKDIVERRIENVTTVRVPGTWFAIPPGFQIK